ncbi:hypothetical protein MPTK2_7g07620 [Marchantia polymorpha subsp. ruderalis]
MDQFRHTSEAFFFFVAILRVLIEVSSSNSCVATSGMTFPCGVVHDISFRTRHLTLQFTNSYITFYNISTLET